MLMLMTQDLGLGVKRRQTAKASAARRGMQRGGGAGGGRRVPAASQKSRLVGTKLSLNLRFRD
jgi:hypothetical protein